MLNTVLTYVCVSLNVPETNQRERKDEWEPQGEED